MYQSYKEFCQCRDVQLYNMSRYEKMDQKTREEKATKVLELMQQQIQHDESLLDVILLRLAPRVDLKIDEIT